VEYLLNKSKGIITSRQPNPENHYKKNYITNNRKPLLLGIVSKTPIDWIILLNRTKDI
jgi:hypothetical protein